MRGAGGPGYALTATEASEQVRAAMRRLSGEEQRGSAMESPTTRRSLAGTGGRRARGGGTKYHSGMEGLEIGRSRAYPPNAGLLMGRATCDGPATAPRSCGLDQRFSMKICAICSAT